MGLWGFVLFIGTFLLTACGGPQPTQIFESPRFKVPALEGGRKSLLQHFALVNDFEEENAPVDPATGRAPFGALLHVPLDGKLGFCSASHVKAGVVVANAHCVDEDKDPNNYFVVFYNQRNWKRYERITSFDFVGNRDALDIAVLRISPEAAEGWDTVEGSPVNTSQEIEASPAALRKVTVWSFDPIEGNHPHLVDRYQGPGMRFHPKHCDGSRTAPSLVGVAGSKKVRIQSRASDSKMHWYVDNCDGRPVKGNSGSLITTTGRIHEILGSFHWVVPYDDKSDGQFSEFEYTGNNGELQHLTPGDMQTRDFYGVGSDFAFLAGQRGRGF